MGWLTTQVINDYCHERHSGLLHPMRNKASEQSPRYDIAQVNTKGTKERRTRYRYGTEFRASTPLQSLCCVLFEAGCTMHITSDFYLARVW